MKQIWWLGCLLIFAACDRTTTPVEEPEVVPISEELPYVHVLLGNPSNAVADIGVPDNFLVVRNQFILGYHNQIGRSKWVSWHLSNNWLGNTPRQDDFRPDNLLPTNYNRITTNDYTGTGFDRGHLCASMDRTKTVADNSATFNMTNMLPMAPEVNQNNWNVMELFINDKMNNGYEAYIISGGYGSGGKGNNGGTANFIGSGDMQVPAYLYKIVALLPNGSGDLERMANARFITVVVPNDNSYGNQSWGNFRVSIDALEAASGLDFLTHLSEELQTTLEAQVDNGPI
jgi:endonuclease G, mitochondrial